MRLLRVKDNIISLPGSTGIYRTSKSLFQETVMEDVCDTYRALKPG